MALTSSDVEAKQAIAEPALTAAEPQATGDLLINLTPLSSEALEAALANLAKAFPEKDSTGDILVAVPDAGQPASPRGSLGALRLLPYAPTVNALFLTSTDYLNAFRTAQEHSARACLLLGPESQ